MLIPSNAAMIGSSNAVSFLSLLCTPHPVRFLSGTVPWSKSRGIVPVMREQYWDRNVGRTELSVATVLQVPHRSGYCGLSAIEILSCTRPTRAVREVLVVVGQDPTEGNVQQDDIPTIDSTDIKNGTTWRFAPE
jgi:hypothetical protein